MLWPPVHLFTLFTTSFIYFPPSLARWSIFTFIVIHPYLPHYTFNIVFSKTGSLTTFLESWGQVSSVFCVQVPSTFLRFLHSYWFDKLGSQSREILVAVLHH